MIRFSKQMSDTLNSLLRLVTSAAWFVLKTLFSFRKPQKTAPIRAYGK